jgi:hypothetical protein
MEDCAMRSADEKNIVSFSKNTFLACGLIVVVTLIASLLWVYKLSKETPGLPSELVKALATEDFTVMPLINAKGEVSYFNRKGNLLTPCASIDGTKVVPIEGGCGPAGEIENINSIKILVTTGSPSCEWVTDDNGKKLYKIHADGRYEGETPCHRKDAHAP